MFASTVSIREPQDHIQEPIQYVFPSLLMFNGSTKLFRHLIIHWIQENASGGSLYWAKVFSSECGIEKAFFYLAYGLTKYDIVMEGRYKVRSNGHGGVYLVPGEGGHIVAQKDDPKEKGTVRETGCPTHTVMEKLT